MMMMKYRSCFLFFLYPKVFGRNLGGQCRNVSNLCSMMLPSFKTPLLCLLPSKAVLVFRLSLLPFILFSLHEFYLGSGQFRIKHASLIFFTSHFISVLCYRNTLSTVFVRKFVTRKSHVYKFTTGRQTVLEK